MSDPLVVCVMLTADRQAMADRAVRCFQRQTYQNKRLLIYDTGAQYFHVAKGCESSVRTVHTLKASSIGELRNRANRKADEADIIAHWDDDDISYPNRLTEQVAALQELRKQGTGVDVVGSRGMWFWDSTGGRYDIDGQLQNPVGQAWYYLHPRPYYCVNASVAYWYSAWERAKFPDTSRAEGHAWLKQLDSSIGFMDRQWVIGCIHEGNRAAYDESRKPGTVGFARGTAEDDERIRKVVEAA